MIASSSDMNAYDTNTGLYGISLARRLNSHAISSSDEMNVQLAPFETRAERRSANFSPALFPAYASGTDTISEEGTGGLSVQMEERRSRMEERKEKAYRPLHRERHVSKALKAYALAVASADKGAVRIIED